MCNDFPRRNFEQCHIPHKVILEYLDRILNDLGLLYSSSSQLSYISLQMLTYHDYDACTHYNGCCTMHHDPWSRQWWCGWPCDQLPLNVQVHQAETTELASFSKCRYHNSCTHGRPGAHHVTLATEQVFVTV